MKVTETEIEGIVIIEPRVFGDSRGFFMESWNKQQWNQPGCFTILFRIIIHLVQ